MMLQSCPKIAHIRCAKCQDGACSDVKQPTAAVEEHAHMLTLTDSQLTVASSAITKVPPCEDDSTGYGPKSTQGCVSHPV